MLTEAKQMAKEVIEEAQTGTLHYGKSVIP